MEGARGFSCPGVAGLCPSTVCEKMAFCEHETDPDDETLKRKFPNL